MCLTIKSERIITKKPITLYKVGDSDDKAFISLYQKFEYLPDVMNDPVNLEIVIRECKRSVSKGYYGFITPKGVLFDCAIQAAQRRCDKPVVAKFEVPVGSTIYYNKGHNELVSSQLIFKKFLYNLDKENAE